MMLLFLSTIDYNAAMIESSEHPVEVLQKFSRRMMVILLFVVALLGGIGLTLILSPESELGRSANRMMWMVPIAMAIAVGASQATLRGRRWDPKSAEVRTVMNDEWRRTSLSRASRIAFIVLIAAQLPLALVIGVLLDVTADRTAMAMAAASMTLGLLTLITLFLVFDRE
jgi:cytochrome bd-type quinol oxidase subunit 1